MRTETDSVETRLDSQTTFESGPDQVSAPEFNVSKQETMAHASIQNPISAELLLEVMDTSNCLHSKDWLVIKQSC